MNAVPVRLFAAQALTATASDYYTSPAGKKTIVSKLTLCNKAATAVAVDIHIGATATTANKLVSAKLIDADTSWSAFTIEGLVLSPNEKIFIKASTDVSAMASGVEIY